MGKFQWIVGGFLVAYSALALIGNIGLLLAWILYRKHSSMIPFVGGIAGLAGLFVLPVPEAQRWFWVPIVADLSISLNAMWLAVFIFNKVKGTLRVSTNDTD